MEIYTDIPEYEGLYKISNYGNIYSCKKDIVLKSQTKNYNKVGLWKESKCKQMKVHQLMAIVFLGHIPDGYNLVVDHIDNDPKNNHISNLQLITHRQNITKDRINTYDLPTGVRKSRNKFISRIQINGKRIILGTFDTPEEASEVYQLRVSESLNIVKS
mgnify:FL=1|tara:strand:- start:22 stop:498 length:477 start_codon:yes stop_codon:yes gene_type:complete